MNNLIYLVNNILNCIKKTEKQREFEKKLYVDGVKILIDKNFETLNQTILSKDLAMKFVLQELDMAQNADSLSQKFVEYSGFQPIEYHGALERFTESENELAVIELIFSDLLENISDEKLMIETSITLVDKIMQHWKLGKYSLSEPISNPIKRSKIEEVSPMKEETEEAIEKIIEEKIIEEKTFPSLIYNTKTVNRLMEEYGDIIPNIITGETSLANEIRINEFKQHMSLAGAKNNSIAIAFCCFYPQKNLDIKIEKMNETSIKFFLQILDGFKAKGYSTTLVEYLEESEDTVWELANQNNKYMQYLIGLWYIEQESEGDYSHAQQLWFEQSANNGFELAISKI